MTTYAGTPFTPAFITRVRFALVSHDHGRTYSTPSVFSYRTRFFSKRRHAGQDERVQHNATDDPLFNGRNSSSDFGGTVIAERYRAISILVHTESKKMQWCTKDY